MIVREDHREFQTLGDLKGRTIAASNALSFPGWQIVLGEVAKFGINPNEFWENDFHGRCSFDIGYCEARIG